MNMKHYPTLHVDTNYSQGTVLLLLFYISVTEGSSIMSLTRTLKYM